MRKRSPRDLNIVRNLHLPVLFILLLGCTVTFSQEIISTDAYCRKPRDLVRLTNGKPRRFRSDELMSRVLTTKPIVRPGSLGFNNIVGVARIELVVDKSGKVSCIRPIAGNPIGVAAVDFSVRRWRFKPFELGGKKMYMFGELLVQYDLRK